VSLMENEEDDEAWYIEELRDKISYYQFRAWFGLLVLLPLATTWAIYKRDWFFAVLAILCFALSLFTLHGAGLYRRELDRLNQKPQIPHSN
jgi:uncharacterized membrane protein